jgi:hypothetical protein
MISVAKIRLEGTCQGVTKLRLPDCQPSQESGLRSALEESYGNLEGKKNGFWFMLAVKVLGKI